LLSPLPLRHSIGHCTGRVAAGSPRALRRGRTVASPRALRRELTEASALDDYSPSPRSSPSQVRSLSIRQGRFLAGSPTSPAQWAVALATAGEAAVDDISAAEAAEQLSAPGWHERKAALITLSELPPQEVQSYATAVMELLSNDPETRVRVSAADCLGRLEKCPAKCVDALVAALSDSQAVLRQASARALGCLKAGQAAQHVADLLEDGDSVVQREASAALGAMGPALAGTATLEKLKHSDADVRAWARRAVVRMKALHDDSSGRSVFNQLHPHLEGVLAHPDSAVRASATEVLEKLNAIDSHSIKAERYTALLRDRSEGVRLTAVKGLGMLGTAAAPNAGTLAERLADRSESVRLAAVQALEKLGEVNGAEAVPIAAALLEDNLQTVRRAASASLAHLGQAARPHLAARHVALLADENCSMRCSAVEELGELAGELRPEQIAAVIALRIDPHWSVRLALARAFRKFGPTVAADPEHSQALDILTIDKDWRVAREAAAARAAAPHSFQRT